MSAFDDAEEFDNDVEEEEDDDAADDDLEEVKLKYIFGFVVACESPPKRFFCKAVFFLFFLVDGCLICFNK